MRFEDWRALEREVEEGGLVVCWMGDLRALDGAGRLTDNIVRRIQEALDERDLAVLGGLSTLQHNEVRIYRRRSELGYLVEAILSPSAAGDKELHRTLDAVRKLDAVRAVLED